MDEASYYVNLSKDADNEHKWVEIYYVNVK